MNREKSAASGRNSKCCSAHVIRAWLVSKLFALPVCWFPREVGSVCDKCTEGRVLLQYASNSSSPRPCDPSGHWSPREAEGTIPYIFATMLLCFYCAVLTFPISPHHCKIQKSNLFNRSTLPKLLNMFLSNIIIFCFAL